MKQKELRQTRMDREKGFAWKELPFHSVATHRLVVGST